MEPSVAPPLQVGQRHTVTITDIAFGGEGVARIGSFVVFVPFVITGEEVEIEMTEVKRSFSRAKPIRILKRSPERVEPLCPYYGDCGGCQYEHISYPLQLEIKRKQIHELFKRIGGFHDDIIQPVVPCPEPYHYRNRIMIRSQWNKLKQGLEIGFLRHDNRLVVDIKECKISEPEINEKLQHVRAHPPYKGGIKVTIRKFPKNYHVPKESFFQNNFFLLPKLVEGVRDAVRSGGAKHLIDVYCGVGFFALECADLVDRYIGVELDAQAIRSARLNAENQQKTNGEFMEGRAEEMLPALLQKFSAEQTAVLVDPPRTGIPADSLRQLATVRPMQLLYVSCHPATLARDIGVLVTDGPYELRRVTPYDMFPQTQHVECIADLRLKQTAGSSQ
ncbi:MAG TPA: class I SAM-dependent RNA methyltransferase [Methylomirabilota bacterium]|nr:class I SAM-dependent RNA methyltransferase [Methylomirabilota bacterium]